MHSPHVWPRQPFVGMALAALGGIILGETTPHPGFALAASIVCAGGALALRDSRSVYVFVGACFFFLHSVQETSSPGIRLAEQLGREPKAISARGIVVGEPRVSEGGMASFHLRLSSVEFDGARYISEAKMLARWRGDVRYGDELQLFGSAQPVAGPRNPGEFDMRSYLARRDVRHSLVVRYPENSRIIARDRGNPVIRAALGSRAWMQSVLSNGLEDSPDLSGLISGMVLGVRDETPDEIEEQFQQTGTLHLFAVSGLNVAIVAYLLGTVAAAMRIPRRWGIGFVIAGVFFYAAVTGLNTSSVRAAVMAAVLLAGFFFDRPVLLGNSVAAAAVLILCCDTNQLFSTGFQLSFVVVIAIILLANPFCRLFVRWFEPDPFLPRSLLRPRQRLGQNVWGGVARGASVSLAAWLGSVPLILPYFYLITPVSLFANLVVVPIAFFVLAVGLMSLLVAPLAPTLSVIFNHANWSLAAAILGSVELFARAPAGHVYFEPRWPSGAHTEITALDLGEGGAIHVRTGRKDWMIDCGGERHFKPIVRSHLRSRGINRLEGMIWTHGDAAHIGAGAAILRTFRPRATIDTGAPDRSAVHKNLIRYFAERWIARRLCAAPEQIRLSRKVTARVLFPPVNHRGPTADDQALVLQLMIAERWRVILLSDSGATTEQLLMASGHDLRSDIVIKGQHHGGASASAEFFAQVQPHLVIAGAPGLREHDQRQDDWAESVRARGITLLRQKDAGAVTLRFFRERWEAIPYLSGEPLRATSR